VLVNASNLEILDIYNDVGTAHDFRMFKESLAGVLPEGILALADSGYQGINEYLPNAVIPFKASKKRPLTEEQKVFNAALAKRRVAVEHINREIKIFRICKETYRNKGTRGLLRVKLIAILYNHRMGF
jgi:transposase